MLNIYLEIKGTQDDAFRAIVEIERLLVAMLSYEQRALALYYMALLNEHRQKNSENKVVRQFCCHLKHMTEMKYMYVSRLPENYKDVIGLLLGKQGSRKKRMMDYTGCFIEYNLKCSNPYYAIYGDSEANVMECTRQIEESIAYAKDKRKR